MLKSALLFTEGIITFLFLIISLTVTYGFKEKVKYKKIIFVSVFLLFSLLFKPMEIQCDNHYIYLLFLIFFSSLFSHIFINGYFLSKMALIITFIYTIVMLKTVLMMIISSDIRNSGGIMDILFYYFSFYSLLYIAALFFKQLPFPSNITFNSKNLIILIASPMCILLFMQLFLFRRNVLDFTANSIIVLVIVFLFIYMVYFLIYSTLTLYENVISSTSMNNKLKMQLSYINFNTELMDQVSHEKHQLKSNYLYIRSLVESGEVKKLNLFLEKELQVNLSGIRLINSGNKQLDLLLSYKLNNAYTKKIPFDYNILIPEKTVLDDEIVAGVFLNLIDNAIEASQNENNPLIKLKIDIVKNYLRVEIRNYIASNVIKQNPQLLSTKRDSSQHGLGLKIVKSVVTKNNGIFKNYIDSNFFVAITMIPLK